MTESNKSVDPDPNAMLSLMDTQLHHDRYFKRIGLAGWCVATFAMLAYALVSLIIFFGYWEHAGDGVVSFHQALRQLVPFLGALGGVGILMALLGAVTLMMRARSASLKEISMRLTNLEDMVLRSTEDQ